jgi:hypothetical protein
MKAPSDSTDTMAISECGARVEVVEEFTGSP